LDSGKIEVDGVDLASLGLETVRLYQMGAALDFKAEVLVALEIINYSPRKLFVQGDSSVSGHITPFQVGSCTDSSSDNIDPAGTKSDAVLNEALSLISANTSASSNLRDKFRLEVAVEDEGSNFSSGERQLRESHLPNQ
jgi:hypothetical protein